MSGSDPQTLTDLLRAVERSADLRTLARECGLSVRELRHRLALWRRELQADHEPDDLEVDAATLVGVPPPLPDPTEKAALAANVGSDRKWPDLPAATTLVNSPLPGRLRSVMEIYTDGASRGNPGPASIGILFRCKGGEDLAEHCEAIGRATNNVAEYKAVVTALEICQRWGVKRVHLKMDSELIVRQLVGAYRVKSPDLRPLYQQVVFIIRGLTEFEVAHVRREQNAHADALANRALDG